MEFPALNYKFQTLHNAFMMFSFIILTLGLITKVSHAGNSGIAMFKPLVTVMILCLMIANAKGMFNFAQKFFMDIAVDIKPGYEEGPLTSVANAIKVPDEAKKNFIQSLFAENVYQSILLAMGKILINFCRLLQLPLIAVQYFLIRTAFIVSPIILSFFMFPTMRQVATRFAVQTLTIMAWPIGFAITNVMADKMLESFSNPVIQANVFGNVSGTVVGNLQTALLAAIVAGIGTVLTPVVMHQLFSAGAGLVESVGSALNMGKAAAMSATGGGKLIMQNGSTVIRSAERGISQGVKLSQHLLQNRNRLSSGFKRNSMPLNRND